jgi:FAD/FMN-containing dehydrogenase
MIAHQSFGRTKIAHALDRPSADSYRLARGYARSYGDACLIDDGYLIDMTTHDKAIALKENLLSAQAGMSLAQVLEIAIPRGLFLEVSPGTKWVSLGGAIANDIHGKNHHRAGSFGCHVHSFELERSNGELIHCSAQEHSDLYFATIGGMGLTGTIRTVQFRLKKASSMIEYQHVPFYSLDEYFDLQRNYDPLHEYTVAWLDGTTPGRGIFMYGDHSATVSNFTNVPVAPRLQVPFDFPSFALNPISIRMFNELYFFATRNKKGLQSFEPFFYPLDKVQNWNRCYGKNGFFQHQCVIPFDRASAVQKILDLSSNAVSFLIVLKAFGERDSKGLMSFPMPGLTLAMDFANRGQNTLDLLRALDRIVEEAGGRIYAAKDATMDPAFFQRNYPNIRKFKEFIDPMYRSNLATRLCIV